MVIKPIPKHLLIHSATYKRYTDDEWEGTTYEEPITLKNVRVEKKSQFNQNANSNNVFFDSELYYDVRNSSPDVEFVENSKVTFEGKTMYVKEVEHVYTNRLHHIVLRLG